MLHLIVRSRSMTVDAYTTDKDCCVKAAAHPAVTRAP